MSTETEQLIDLITEQTRDLLTEHWTDIQSYRDGDADIKISFSHALSYEGDERTVKTTIAFSHRIKDEVENSFSADQASLELGIPALPKKRK